MDYNTLQALLSNDDHSLQENSIPTGLYNQLRSIPNNGQDISIDPFLAASQYAQVVPQGRRGRQSNFATVANAPSYNPPTQQNNSPLQNMPELGLPSDRWLSYANPLQQKLAQASGLYDPHYASPRAKLEAAADQTIQTQNLAYQQQQQARAQAAYAQSGSQYAPQIVGGVLQNPQQFLTTQIGGDSTGTTSKILRSLSGGVPGQDALQPYVPSGGFGRQDTDQSSLDPLDRTVYHDQTFQQELARNPERAKFAYQHLTGRSLDDDLKSTQDFRKKQIDTGYSFASDAIKNGAVFDPASRKWKLWQTANPSAEDMANASLGKTPQPFRQLVEATPDQNRWLNLHHKNVTGQELEAAPPQASPSTLANVSTQLKDPASQAAVAALATKLNRTPTPQESQIAIALHKEDAARILEQQAGQGIDTSMGRILSDSIDAMMGYKPQGLDGNILPRKDSFIQKYYPAEDGSNLNWLGKLMQEMRNGFSQNPFSGPIGGQTSGQNTSQLVPVPVPQPVDPNHYQLPSYNLYR